MRRFRAAVLGLNHYHVTGWVESLGALADRIEVVVLYDPDPDRQLRMAPHHADPNLSQALPSWASDIPFETDLGRVIDEYDLDIALVTLPNRDVPDAIARCAAAGVHLLVDKPSARTSDEAERAFDVVRSTGVKAAVALTRRYGRGWQEVAAMIASGRLGRLLTTEAIFVTSSVAIRDPSNHIFRKDEMGGGVLHWLGVHDLDQLLWFTGERITEVTATIGDSAIDVEDVVSASISYESGAVGTLHFAYALPGSGGEGYVAIRGTDGSVKILPDGSWTWTGSGTLLDPVLSQASTYQSRPSSGHGVVGAVIIDDLLRAIEEDRDPLATGAHAIEALCVIDAIYASAASGQRTAVRQ